MRGLVVVGALLLVACGPSKAEMAFQACQTQMAAQNWSAAMAQCKLACELDPANELYSRTKRMIRSEVISAAAQRTINAMQTQAAIDAQEDQARVLADMEYRQRLRDAESH